MIIFYGTVPEYKTKRTNPAECTSVWSTDASRKRPRRPMRSHTVALLTRERCDFGAATKMAGRATFTTTALTSVIARRRGVVGAAIRVRQMGKWS